MIIDAVLSYIEKNGLNNYRFEKAAGLSNAYLANIKKSKSEVQPEMLKKMIAAFPDLENYLESCQGLSSKIPLFQDVGSVGGLSLVASDHGAVQPTDMIDPGELFPGATAAIRHYGESMVEYPPGSILFIRKIDSPFTFIWGEDYVIEYDQYRITKRIQKGADESLIRAHSTNKDKYEDGSLVHQPIDIPLSSIRRVFLVIGHIRKNNR